MARRSNKNRKSGKQKRRSPLTMAREMDWTGVRRTVSVVTWTTAATALVLGWMIGLPKLEAAATQRADTEDGQIRFVDAPKWMRGDLKAHLVMTAEQQIDGGVLARQDLIDIRSVLIETGWFESIKQVRRVHDDLIHVQATFVTPYAVIRDDDGDHLIDPRGKLLPRTYPTGANDNFIAIIDSRYDRPNQSGELWPGADINAALRLLRVIAGKPWIDQVTAINVGQYLDDQTLILKTDRGSRIIWGSAPGEEQAGEALVEQKLKYLEYHHERHGHIDRNHDGAIDITSTVAVVEKP